MDLEEIQSLIKFVAKSGATEVELETGDFKIIIKTPHKKLHGNSLEAQQEEVVQVPVAVSSMHPVSDTIPAVPTPAEVPAEAGTPDKTEKSEESEYVTITSPMIGTFYRSASPDDPTFVNVGDDISPGKVICIIEAMKLFNEIEAEISGKIVKVLVEDATPVEYDQPLFLVDPA